MKNRHLIFNWFALSASALPLITLASCGGESSSSDVPKQLTEEEQWDKGLRTTTQQIESNWQSVYQPYVKPGYYQYDPGPGYTFYIPSGVGISSFRGENIPRDFQLRPDTVKIASSEFGSSKFFYKHQFALPEKVYELASGAFAGVVLPRSFKLNVPISISYRTFAGATLYEDFIIPLVLNEANRYQYRIVPDSFENAILPPGCNWFNEHNEEVLPEQITETNYPTWGWQVRVSKIPQPIAPTVSTNKK